MTKLNVPAFKQHYSATCGITCARMINAYFHPELSQDLNSKGADRLYSSSLLSDLKELNVYGDSNEALKNKYIISFPENKTKKNIKDISLDEYINISKSGDEIRLLANHILKNNMAIMPFDGNNLTEQSLENYLHQVSREYLICPPLINKNNHYMLITGIKGSNVYYNDPLDGKEHSMPFENLKSENCQVLKVGPESFLLPKSMRK